MGQEEPLEEEMATHSSILAWRTPLRGAWRATVHGAVEGNSPWGRKEWDTTEQLSIANTHTHTHTHTDTHTHTHTHTPLLGVSKNLFPNNFLFFFKNLFIFN